MAFLLQQLKSDSPSMEQTTSLSTPTDSETVLIQYAFELLELYLETEDSSPLMPLLKQIRNEMLEDLDQVESIKEIYGLMYWLMADILFVNANCVSSLLTITHRHNNKRICI